MRRRLLAIGGIDLASDTCVCGHGWIYGRGAVRIGPGTWLSPGVVIHSHLEADIVIGARCDLGPGVELIPGSHVIGTSKRRAGPGTALPIAIGDGCWIGAGSRILGGVTIGDGCVIAAGAVVTRSLPQNVLAAGVPATVKRSLMS